MQYYKLLRLGKEDYMQNVENQMASAAFIRHFLKDQIHKPTGKPRFQMLDGGDTGCLPVVSARINPDLNLHYNDIGMLVYGCGSGKLLKVVRPCSVLL